jgi:hypothetical protein
VSGADCGDAAYEPSPIPGPVFNGAMSEITPDDKDWTWTLESRCPDCGFEASTIPAGPEVSRRFRAATEPWREVLARPDVRERPGPTTWSPLEYACHVRDVCRIFLTRLQLMLDEDDSTFANWDQDAAAVADRYGTQDPAVVTDEVEAAGAALAGAYAAVPDDAWERSGLRSNGSRFSVLTLGQYGLHDLVHHLWDVGAKPRE